MSELKNCRICQSTELHEYLDLGMMPIINKLENTAENARKVKKFPLKVLFCGECGLSQLSYVVDPSELYDYYPYRSSISKTFIEHCRELAEYYCDKFNLTKDDLIVDIASNDGALLKCFKDLGIKVLGIEPAQNLAKIAEEQGIPTIAKFWDRECAEIIIEKKFYPSIVFGTNVFAHVHNVHDFIRNAKMVLKPVDGRLVLEFPYLPDLFNQNAFDTIYHEHLSYFLIHPLLKLCDSQALVISNITWLPIHGGSVRVEFAEKTWNTKNEILDYYLNLEWIAGFREAENYINWGERIKGLIEGIKSKLITIKEQNKKISAFGAAAKGNVLLNSINADNKLIDYIVDDTPEKIGKFAPGTGIPIVNREELKRYPPDYLLILPWNFKDEIITNMSGIFDGEYIVAVPEFEIIERETILR